MSRVFVISDRRRTGWGGINDESLVIIVFDRRKMGWDGLTTFV